MRAQIKKAGAARAPALAEIKKPALEERRMGSKDFPPRSAARGSLDDYFWMFA
jgi:hypothetical protein